MERWRDGDRSEWWRETIEGGMLGRRRDGTIERRRKWRGAYSSIRSGKIFDR